MVLLQENAGMTIKLKRTYFFVKLYTTLGPWSPRSTYKWRRKPWKQSKCYGSQLQNQNRLYFWEIVSIPSVCIHFCEILLAPYPETEEKSAPTTRAGWHGTWRSGRIEENAHHSTRPGFAEIYQTIQDWRWHMWHPIGACHITRTCRKSSETNRGLVLIVMWCRDKLWLYSKKMLCGDMGCIALSSLLGRDTLRSRNTPSGSAMDHIPQKIAQKTSLLKTPINGI